MTRPTLTALPDTAPAAPPRFRAAWRLPVVRGEGWRLLVLAWLLLVLALALAGCVDVGVDRVGRNSIAVTCGAGLTPVAVISANVALVSCVAKESP